jgi:hypothetical protein
MRVITTDPRAALALGLAVFPLDGRTPARPDWARAATADPAAVLLSWPAGVNVGVGCRASDLVVLDLDQHPGGPDGMNSLAGLCAFHGAGWPRTLTVRTPHGRHLYFRAPHGFAVASGPLGPGVDVRGPGRRSGGYVVGPGSVVDGHTYTADDTEIALCPDWLIPILPGPRNLTRIEPRYRR